MRANLKQLQNELRKRNLAVRATETALNNVDLAVRDFGSNADWFDMLGCRSVAVTADQERQIIKKFLRDVARHV